MHVSVLFVQRMGTSGTSPKDAEHIEVETGVAGRQRPPALSTPFPKPRRRATTWPSAAPNFISSPLLTKKGPAPHAWHAGLPTVSPSSLSASTPIDCRVPSSLPPSPLCPLVVAVACTVVCPQPSDQLIHLLPKPSDFGDFDGWDHTDLRLHSLLCLLFEPQLPAPSGTPAPYRTGWW